ncbi:winged helix-turn-helix transcriptional regulator [Streptomyces asiaticus]
MSEPRLDDRGRELLDQLFDKWSLVVLDVLCDGPHRFNEIRREVGPVTPKSLSQTLRRLERNGVVERRVLATSPVAVEYRITDLGRSLEAPLRGMLRWIVRHLPEIDVQRSKFEERS